MNEKHYFLDSHGLIKRKLTALFLSLILVVILSIYLIGCSDSGSSGSSQGGYFTNSGTPIATLNQVDKPVLDVSSEGQVAWAQRTGDMDTIYSYRNESAFPPDTSIATIVATVEHCSDIATNNAGQIAWVEFDDNGSGLWFYSNGEKGQIPTGQGVSLYPNMNGSGHLVWTSVNEELLQAQIYLYRDGTTTQITQKKLNAYADINDKGDITWNELNGENVTIYLRDKDGQVTKITENDLDAFAKSWEKAWKSKDGSGLSGVLNSTSSFVWQAEEGEATQIFMYRDGQVTQITNDDKDSRFPDINDHDQIVWEGRDENDTEIFLYSGGTITQLTDNDIFDTKPRINNHGQVVWEAYDDNDDEVFIYDNGTIVQLTDNEIYDESPQICDSGQVFWLTSEPGEATWYYANIMTTVPGQESRTEAESPESSTLPPAGTDRITEGDEANNLCQIDNQACTYPSKETFKPPADPDNFTFVVFGDTRGANKSIFWDWDWKHKKVPLAPIINEPWLNCLKTHLLDTVKPNLIFYGGDVSTYRDVEAWNWFKDDFVMPLKEAGHYVFMTKGNHDCYKQSVVPMIPAGYNWYGIDRQREYQKIFNFGWVPKNGPYCKTDPAYNNLVYYFTYGHSLFFIFDTYFIHGYTPGLSDPHMDHSINGVMYDWFKNCFKDDYFKKSKHKFAFSHAPVWSVEGEKLMPLMPPLWILLTERLFDIYFGSHTHLYSRKNIPKKFKGFEISRDMVQVVAGRMTPSIDDAKVKDKVAWHIDQRMHFVVVKVAGPYITSTAYALYGEPPCWSSCCQTIEIDGFTRGPRFTDHGDGTVTDHKTQLMWSKNANLGGAMSWQDAKSYCEKLTLAGHDDWRLPSLNRVTAMMSRDTKHDHYPPAGNPFLDIQWGKSYTTNTPCNQEDPESGDHKMTTFCEHGPYPCPTPCVSDSINGYVWPVRVAK